MQIQNGTFEIFFQLPIRICFELRFSNFGFSRSSPPLNQFFLYTLCMKPELSSLFINELSTTLSTLTSETLGFTCVSSRCNRFMPSKFGVGTRSNELTTA